MAVERVENKVQKLHYGTNWWRTDNLSKGPFIILPAIISFLKKLKILNFLGTSLARFFSFNLPKDCAMFPVTLDLYTGVTFQDQRKQEKNW